MAIVLKANKAVRNKRPCRFFVSGVSGSGKTLSSLLIARGLVGEKGRIVLFDTENSSASLYSDHKDILEFDHFNIDQHSPIEDYLSLFKQADEQGYNAIILDSATHFWEAVKDRATQESKKFGGNSASGWMTVTPMLKKNIFDQLRINAHVIYAVRSKTEYLYETNEKGKITPKKVGMAPEFKGGIEFEFDIVGRLDQGNFMHIEKSRYLSLELHDKVIEKPGIELGKKIVKFLEAGESIKYGLSDIHFESEEKCVKAIEYLKTKGARLIDNDYKIVELDNRLTEIESKESWRVKILHSQEDINNYKKYFKEYLLDNPPLQEVATIEELGDKLAEVSNG